MLFPYRIETLYKQLPVANWVIIGLTVLAFWVTDGESLPADWIEGMVLDGWSPTGFLGYVWLHADFFHLAGNMFALWVFGNAVCGNTGNALFAALYFGLGIVAGIAHVVIIGEPVVGASGAVNGIVGVAFALYPLNRVNLFYWVLFRPGTFKLPLWCVALAWLALDFFGATVRTNNVAYWAHIGGFLGGVAVGLIALRRGWVTMLDLDYRSLEEILTGKTVAERDPGFTPDVNPAPTAFYPAITPAAEISTAAAAADSLVMPATTRQVIVWCNRAEAAASSPETRPEIAPDDDRAERLRLETRYATTFLELGFSFHRSLADYYRCVATGALTPHERPALIKILRIVEKDFAAMVRCGFVDEDVLARRDEERLADFLRLGPRTAEG